MKAFGHTETQVLFFNTEYCGASLAYGLCSIRYFCSSGSWAGETDSLNTCVLRIPVCLAVVAKDVAPLAMTLAAVAAAALVFGTIRLLYQIEVVSVFGRRSKASIRFGFRRARAAQMFNEICANVAAAQRRLAREIAANEPPEQTVPAEELPPMPEEEQQV